MNLTTEDLQKIWPILSQSQIRKVMFGIPFPLLNYWLLVDSGKDSLSHRQSWFNKPGLNIATTKCHECGKGTYMETNRGEKETGVVI